MIKKILFFLIGWKLLTLLFALAATAILPLNLVFTPYKSYGLNYPYLTFIWANFDGIHYLEIAERGYFLYEQAFFPFYPMLVSVVSSIIDYKYLIGGLVVSHVSFFLAIFIVWKLLGLDSQSKLFLILLLILILFPTSPFYGAVYNDSLFFFLSLLCIYFGRRRNWIFATLTGALATLTRLNGLALFFYLLFEYAYASKSSPYSREQLIAFVKKLTSSATIRNFFTEHVYIIILIPLTFISYLLYIEFTQGDWTMVFSSMKVWNQAEITFPLQVIWRYLKIFFDRSFSITYWVAIIEFLFVVWYAASSIYSYTRIRFSYWIFMNLSFLIPALTGTFAGMPRYGLHLYPFFLSLAIFLFDKPRFIKILYFSLSMILMFVVTMLFTRGYFIS